MAFLLDHLASISPVYFIFVYILLKALFCQTEKGLCLVLISLTAACLCFMDFWQPF